MSSQYKQRDGFVLFHSGVFSQWHPSKFKVNDVDYGCCEQFMMAMKATTFKDSDTLKAIMASNSPKEQKTLGRQVRNFNADAWTAVCRDVVYLGNMAKFGQDDGLKKILVGTGDQVIVEASPSDQIWGIGMGADDPRATIPEKWRGKNWLGEALMKVRNTLRNQAEEY